MEKATLCTSTIHQGRGTTTIVVSLQAIPYSLLRFSFNTFSLFISSTGKVRTRKSAKVEASEMNSVSGTGVCAET